VGFFDRLFGTNDSQDTTPQYRRTGAPRRTDDDIAVERYRYLLRTAPPETIEQVHLEAFSKLTPEQRDLLFQQLLENAPEGDKPKADDAASLATSATRSELRQPGTMERSMGGRQGMGFGSMVASSLLGTVAGYVIGSALVGAFLPDDGSGDATDASADDASADSASSDGTDAGGDFGSDFGGGDFGGGDFGF
jgi:hypothetical protein